jgi:hypothetical protein
MTRHPESHNPYACPAEQPPVASLRISWLSLGMALAAFALISMAGSRFLSVALESRGLLAGVLVAGIGAVVGRIIGTQPRARGMTILASSVMFLGLVNGWVDHEGEERILWAFACMCGGLLLGTAYPAEPDELEDAASPRGTTGTEDEGGDERRS